MRLHRNVSIAFTALAISLWGGNRPALSAPILQMHNGRYRTATIIVKFKDMSEAAEQATLRAYGCHLAGRCRMRELRRVRIASGQTPRQMVRILRDEPVVEYAELNYMAHMTFVPNDVHYALQWNLHDAASGGINMEGAWDIQTGDPNVIIAILDTGVAYEDFNEFIEAPDFARTRFVPGYDFINDDNHPNDDQGHGTHVAGTIAQSTNNEIGVAGIAFGCSLCPIKVLDEEGYGDHFTISQGIYFAIAQGARVINLSLGSDAHSRTLRDAVAYAYDQGVTIVCSAGNEFLKGNSVSYPAAYDDYCIAVGATAFDKIRAPYSSTGDYVDLCAPGGNVLMDLNHDGYVDGILQQTFQTHVDDFAFWFLQGTSMAAPHVSGAAALLVSQGITKPDRVREALENTAVDLGQPGWDTQYGWGLVDVEAALLYWDDESPY